MRLHGCDRECRSCPLLELCGGIEQYNVKGYRCPYAGCELEAPALRKMRECKICRFSKITYDLTEVEVAELLSDITKLEQVTQRSVVLPEVVPIVPLEVAPALRLDSLGMDAIIVSYQDLLDERLRDEVLDVGGIHQYLEFEGKVLLSSIMPDELLIREDVFENFLCFFKAAGFDMAIAWDVPVYIDIPLYDSWVNLLMGLKLAHELAEQGVPIIGLLKGNVERQIAFSAETLSKMGIEDMALHASEYMSAFNEDAHVRQILYTYFGYASRLASSLLLIGVLGRRWPSFLRNVVPKSLRLSLAGMGWLIDAERGLLYSGDGYIDAHSAFVKCSCSACSEIRPREMLTEVGARARHNLNNLVERVRGNKPLELRAYDLILEEGESALLVSDLHLWTGRALLNSFVDFLLWEEPENVLFLGDTFDLEKGRQNFLDITRFFDVLRDLGPTVLVAKGCSDSNQEALLKALDHVAMEGCARPLLWAESEDERAKRATFDLYRFYRCAKDYLEVRLADGSVVLAAHGNDVVGDVDTPLEVVVEAMEGVRARRHAKWFVMGHLHRAFVDEEKGVASTGCWALSRPSSEKMTEKSDLGTAILIHGDGRLELIRGG